MLAIGNQLWNTSPVIVTKSFWDFDEWGDTLLGFSRYSSK